MDKIIGRESELGLLDKYNKSGKSEFVALYGRRRVGKTSLEGITLKISLTSMLLVC